MAGDAARAEPELWASAAVDTGWSMAVTTIARARPSSRSSGSGGAGGVCQSPAMPVAA